MLAQSRLLLLRSAAAPPRAARGSARQVRRAALAPSAASAAGPPPAIGRARAASTRAVVYYQGPGAPASLASTGQVGTHRDLAGSDGEFFGVDPRPTEVAIEDGRGRRFTMDENGFQLERHEWGHVDYYSSRDVLDAYYPECERLVCERTGAKWALAFDHNVRAASRKKRHE
ncbi:unnamed protein product [Prorocentrum cordatum]|nr:unnamed protein product [Polarella glacialis]